MICFRSLWCYFRSLWVQSFLVSVILIVGVLYVYPKIVIRCIQRWLIFRSGFSIRSVQVSPDFTFEYMEKGSVKNSSKSLLLLHGFSQSKDAMCLFGKHIPAYIHTIVVDLPGHGGTSVTMRNDAHIHGFVERIQEFTAATGLQRQKFHLLGHSLGGLLAGLYALKFPEHLNSLTLVGCAGVKSPTPSPFESEYEKSPWKQSLLVPNTTQEFQDMMKTLVHNPSPIPSIFVRGAMQIRMEHHEFYKRAMDRFVADNARHVLTDYLHNIKTPTLVVWGQHDRIVDVSCTEVLRDKIPSCVVVILEACGHIVPFERPKALANVVLDFIGR